MVQMQSTEQLFKEAIQLERLFHLCVHMEADDVQNRAECPIVKAAYNNANQAAILMTENNVPNLLTTFRSPATAPKGPNDIEISSSSFSGLENETHLAFLDKNKPLAGCISGAEAHRCVTDSRSHMERAGPKPIMLADSIDFSQIRVDLEISPHVSNAEIGKMLWGENAHIATNAEIQTWIKEM